MRKEWLVGAACALTAAGLSVVVIEMAQIHPHQYLYFNFLVDRKTPERLRSRYAMSHYSMARSAYEYLLRQPPAAAINMKRKHFRPRFSTVRTILPAADRRRFTHDPSRDPDFYLEGGGLGQWQGHPLVLHRFKVYNNTIMAVSTPDLSRVDPAVADEYRALHRAATAGEPVARAGGYEVYRHGHRLAWVKEACEPGALMHPFRLALYPANPRGYFKTISVRGARFDGKCLGMARLPDFALVRRVRLGQPGRWEVEVPL